jgi:hypothetical protein
MLGGRATARHCQTTPALEQASAGTRRLAAAHGGLTSHDLDLVNTGIVPHRAGAVTDPAGPVAGTTGNSCFSWGLLGHRFAGLERG